MTWDSLGSATFGPWKQKSICLHPPFSLFLDGLTELGYKKVCNTLYQKLEKEITGGVLVCNLFLDDLHVIPTKSLNSLCVSENEFDTRKVDKEQEPEMATGFFVCVCVGCSCKSGLAALHL